MLGRRWVSRIALAGFAWLAVGFVSVARAEEASKDSSSAKSPDGGKKKAAGKAKKRPKPLHEGDTDDRGVIYTK
jgi:hypothetical protein